MPRSGTTFLHGVFAKYGSIMTPRVWCCPHLGVYGGHHLSTNEPADLSILLSAGSRDDIGETLNRIQQTWSHCSRDSEILIKTPPFVFFNPHDWFSRTIVCVREDLGTWEWSALDHGLQTVIDYGERVSWLSPHLSHLLTSEHPLYQLGVLWRERSYSFHNQRPLGTSKLFRYGSLDDFRSLLEWFNCSYEVSSEIFEKDWSTKPHTKGV